ncbi:MULTISPECIES: ComF family protein [unclassified Tenacibaculum]|uniref:ComF family protein n=1 Tax=unclassified Tenacibaculum TaxID=2635139 RepID=UPI001F3A1298|nr:MULTISPECIES: ComF family protein [unclassified Tenacibaculum]MCF2874932.1 ComF family protein [Tenacibaculum sp. Cn5-1]MCF2934002.1 ComF family protein [Tenacibaculum sp. Cn5-34]MCG7510212.1 ComF family protein [Tenacibaculum sp. Cn5-46]
MRLLKEIFYLFYPNLCVNCTLTLLQNEKHLCTTCNNDLPIIDDNPYTNVTMLSTFYGKVPIKSIRSFLYYQKHGITQKIIHELKYKNQQQIGVFLANRFGYLLKESNIFNHVDYILPVPLHPKKLKNRGYNQLTKFGQTLSEVLDIKYIPDILIKVSVSKTQTFKKRFDRFSNNKTKFKLTSYTFFEKKHVLLIDDVITTGATLENCCKELLKTKDITISIATMAYTKNV